MSHRPRSLSMSTRVTITRKHKNGTLKSRTDYVGYKKDGIEMIFDDNLRMILMAHYVDNRLNGKYICLNNDCINEYNYHNGVLDGPFIERKSDGSTIEGEYMNGKKYEYDTNNTSTESPRTEIIFDTNGVAKCL